MYGSRVTPLWPHKYAHGKKSAMIVLSEHLKTLMFYKIIDVLSSKLNHCRSLYINTFPFDRVLSAIDRYRFELTQLVTAVVCPSILIVHHNYNYIPNIKKTGIVCFTCRLHQGLATPMCVLPLFHSFPSHLSAFANYHHIHVHVVLLDVELIGEQLPAADQYRQVCRCEYTYPVYRLPRAPIPGRPRSVLGEPWFAFLSTCVPAGGVQVRVVLVRVERRPEELVRTPDVLQPLQELLCLVIPEYKLDELSTEHTERAALDQRDATWRWRVHLLLLLQSTTDLLPFVLIPTTESPAPFNPLNVIRPVIDLENLHDFSVGLKLKLLTSQIYYIFPFCIVSQQLFHTV